jgi:CRP-like cAMP-binding protein
MSEYIPATNDDVDGRFHARATDLSIAHPEVSLHTRAYPSTRFSGLLTNAILTTLPGSDLARLLPHLEPVSLIAGRGVNEFGSVSDFIYFPESAVISHIHILEDGGTTAAAIVGRDGLIGLSALLGTESSYWAQVTVSGSALRVRSSVIKEEFWHGHAMQHLILNHLGARLAQLSQKAVCNSRHLLEERFCTWLLMIRDRTRCDEVALTHEMIAQHMGARRAGITAVCNALREAGIIRYRRRLLTILDRSKLESVACECYRVLQGLNNNGSSKTSIPA